MTATQWQIYNAIKESVVISSEELCKKLGYEIDIDSQKRNLSRKSMELYKEIENINDDPIIQKPILWDDKNNYWLARSKEDVEKFVQRIYKKPALKKLAKMWNLVRKSERDGVGDLFAQLDSQSKARKFVESFVDDLTIIEEIQMLEKENYDIEFDENKYLNGNYEKRERNLERIEELKKWQKERYN